MRFGEYEIVERVGIEGEGFDAVARDASGREVRLWVGRPGSGLGGLSPSDLKQSLGRVFHTSLPRLLGAEVIEDRAVIVTAPYHGRRLHERLREGPLDPPEALDLVKSVGAGLAKAHRAGVVHGAVAASEILLSDDGRTVLLHVGFAPFLATRDARAPEDEGRPEGSPSGDVFGLARVLFECLSGRDPFAGGAGSVFRDPARPDPEEISDVFPEGLRRFLARALMADRASRVHRAEELAGDIGVIRASWGPYGPRTERPARGPGNRRLVFALIVGAAIALWVVRG